MNRRFLTCAAALLAAIAAGSPGAWTRSDAPRRIDANGPFAGTHPVAVDTIALKIILEKRQQLRGEPWPLCVAAADQRYGLGTSRLSEIKLNMVGWTDGHLL